MKKQYTRKQIQEAIDYWQKQLDEGLFGIGNPVKKFMDELKRAAYKPLPAKIAISMKDGKSHLITGFDFADGIITFYSDGGQVLTVKAFIEQMNASGIKAKSIKQILVEFPDKNVYEIQDVAIMDGRDTAGRFTLIVINAGVQSVSGDSAEKFFS